MKFVTFRIWASRACWLGGDRFSQGGESLAVALAEKDLDEEPDVEAPGADALDAAKDSFAW
jgi:hypothetical protein